MIIIQRKFGLLSSNTFSIKPIMNLISRHIRSDKHWLDPFANNSIFNRLCYATNDLNPQYSTTYHEDALVFLQRFPSASIDGVLCDPPYSPRQIKECYDALGIPLHEDDTQSRFWSDIKNAIARVLRPNGLVISCGWNSNGMGKSRGFVKLEILMVYHGGVHHDTLVTVERKATQTLDECLTKKS